MIIKRDKVLGYQYRIRELEEILCPAESHRWKQAGFYFVGGTGMGDETTMYRYVCRKCKKRMETIQPLMACYEEDV